MQNLLRRLVPLSLLLLPHLALATGPAEVDATIDAIASWLCSVAALGTLLLYVAGILLTTGFMRRVSWLVGLQVLLAGIWGVITFFCFTLISQAGPTDPPGLEHLAEFTRDWHTRLRVWAEIDVSLAVLATAWAWTSWHRRRQRAVDLEDSPYQPPTP